MKRLEDVAEGQRNRRHTMQDLKDVGREEKTNRCERPRNVAKEEKDEERRKGSVIEVEGAQRTG